VDNIILIPDNKNVFHKWIIKETVVNKYNPNILTHRIILEKDHRLFTDIYVSKTYNENGKLYYNKAVPTGDGLNIATYSFGVLRLE